VGRDPAVVVGGVAPDGLVGLGAAQVQMQVVLLGEADPAVQLQGGAGELADYGSDGRGACAVTRSGWSG